MSDNNYCEWVYVDNDWDYWETECGEAFDLGNSDTLEENKIKYCPFCGKKIKEVKK